MADRLWLGRTIFTACAILIVGALLWLASGYPPRARYIPEIVAIFALVCLSIQLVIEIVTGLRQRTTPLPEGPPAEEAEAVQAGGSVRLELIAYFWLAGMLLGLFLVGFLVSIPLYVLLYLRFQAKIGWLGAFLYGFGTWAFTYFLFVRLFEIRLYYGILFESWMDF